MTLEEQLKEEKKSRKKLKRLKKGITTRSMRSSRVIELANHVKRMYEVDDLPMLFMKVLRKLSPKGHDLTFELRKFEEFTNLLSTIHAERDQSNANYLREHVYNDAAFALLRLCVNLSKRECALV